MCFSGQHEGSHYWVNNIGKKKITWTALHGTLRLNGNFCFKCDLFHLAGIQKATARSPPALHPSIVLVPLCCWYAFPWQSKNWRKWGKIEVTIATIKLLWGWWKLLESHWIEGQWCKAQFQDYSGVTNQNKCIPADIEAVGTLLKCQFLNCKSMGMVSLLLKAVFMDQITLSWSTRNDQIIFQNAETNDDVYELIRLNSGCF